MSELIEGDELTPEQIEADAKMEAADLGPIYAPMLQAKRDKAAKVHRKKKDRRFKLSALDESEGAASSIRSNEDDPWDSSVPVSDEVRRIALLICPYLDRGAATNVFRPDINKREMFDKIFDGRQQTTANLLKLYAFMQTKYPSGSRCLSSSPLFYIVEEILLKAGEIKEPLSQPMTVTFGDEFEERLTERSGQPAEEGK